MSEIESNEVEYKSLPSDIPTYTGGEKPAGMPESVWEQIQSQGQSQQQTPDRPPIPGPGMSSEERNAYQHMPSASADYEVNIGSSERMPGTMPPPPGKEDQVASLGNGSAIADGISAETMEKVIDGKDDQIVDISNATGPINAVPGGIPAEVREKLGLDGKGEDQVVRLGDATGPLNAVKEDYDTIADYREIDYDDTIEDYKAHDDISLVGAVASKDAGEAVPSVVGGAADFANAALNLAQKAISEHEEEAESSSDFEME